MISHAKNPENNLGGIGNWDFKKKTIFFNLILF